MLLSHRALIVGGILGKFINLETESQMIYDPAAAKEIKIGEHCRALNSYTDEDAPIITVNSYDDMTHQSQITITGTVIDSGLNASGIVDVTAIIDGAHVPASLSGDNVTLNLQLAMGDNFCTLMAHDFAGNEISIPFYVIRILRLNCKILR